MFWRRPAGFNPRPDDPKPSALSTKLQAHAAGLYGVPGSDRLRPPGPRVSGGAKTTISSRSIDDVVEAMRHVGADEDRVARLDVALFSGHGHLGTPADDDVDLVLEVWRLRVGAAGRQPVIADAHGRYAQELVV